MFERFGILVFVAAAALAGLAQAQTPSRQAVEEGMETCRTIEVDFMRRACLDAGDAFLEGSSEPGVVAEIAVPSDPEVVVAGDTEAAIVADAEETEKRRRFGLLSRRETSADGSDGLGVSVVGIRPIGQGRAQFRLDDGSVLEMFGGGFDLKDPSGLPASARLDRRLFGSTWLTFDEFPKRGYKVRVIRPGN